MIPDGTDRPDEAAAIPIGLRTDWAIDFVLDELAAEAVGWPGRMAVPADPIAPPATRPGPAGGPARLAAALIVAGSWGDRARFRKAAGVRGRRCQGPPMSDTDDSSWPRWRPRAWQSTGDGGGASLAAEAGPETAGRSG